MAIYGNMVGSSGGILGKTVEIISDDGTDLMGVITDKEEILDAKPSDVRIGKKVVTDNGIIEGTREFLSYRTIRASRLVLSGDEFSITLSENNQYDYTKIQCVIAKMNTSFSDSVAVDKVVIGDSVYEVNSTNVLSTLTKDESTKTIDLNIINDTEDTYVIHYFTFKELNEEELA